MSTPKSTLRVPRERFNLHGGEVLSLTSSPYATRDMVGYRSYRDLIAAHAYHKETTDRTRWIAM